MEDFLFLGYALLATICIFKLSYMLECAPWITKNKYTKWALYFKIFKILVLFLSKGFSMLGAKAHSSVKSRGSVASLALASSSSENLFIWLPSWRAKVIFLHPVHFLLISTLSKVVLGYNSSIYMFDIILRSS